VTTKLPVSFSARSVAGSGRGRAIGYPTINLEIDDIPKDIEEGIYAGFASFVNCQKSAADGRVNCQLFAAIHFGPRLFHKDSNAFEVHVFDAELDELPNELDIELIKKLRDIKDFENEEDLKSQISMDIEEARAILGAS
jgi:riboflavin kinase/FMN adenylyltransferase|tara:strand:- start:8476 stop:8892 length:417 start_codon:yes stop_codon:yes gene_type:complete